MLLKYLHTTQNRKKKNITTRKMIEGQTEPTPAAVSTQSLEEKQQEALIANILEHVPGWSEAVQASD